MATVALRPPPQDTSMWLKHGITAGILAGVIFIAFEMAAAALIMGTHAVFLPLRMIGAIILGASALDSAAVASAAAGAIVHLLLSATFGAVFGTALGLMVGAVPPVLRSTRAIVAVATAYGFALWVVNFYGIAPRAGWVWFPRESDPVVQFVAHTVFFGAPLGLYLADRNRAKRARVPRVQIAERMRRAG